MIEAVSFRPGTIFEDADTKYEVLKFQHHRTAMADAICRVKLKDLKSGAITERTYRPNQRFKEVNVEKKEKTFLYFDGDLGHFMDMVTFETVAFPKKKLGNIARFLAENMMVEALYGNDELLDIVLPPHVPLKVMSAPPGVRGDSAHNPSKTVTLENGIEVATPLFIKEGDLIKVDTETGEYVERVS